MYNSSKSTAVNANTPQFRCGKRHCPQNQRHFAGRSRGKVGERERHGWKEEEISLRRRNAWHLAEVSATTIPRQVHFLCSTVTCSVGFGTFFRLFHALSGVTFVYYALALGFFCEISLWYVGYFGVNEEKNYDCISFLLESQKYFISTFFTFLNAVKKEVSLESLFADDLAL